MDFSDVQVCNPAVSTLHSLPRASSRPPSRRKDAHDLRRSARRADGRDHGQLCVERSIHLDPAERALVLAVYRDGMSLKELADLLTTPVQQGCSSLPDTDIRRSGAARVRLLRRRLRRTVSRLLSPKFEFCAAYIEPRDQEERRRLGLPCWPPLRRRVAEECVIRGCSIRSAARTLDVSLHIVRGEIDRIHALFESHMRHPRSPRFSPDEGTARCPA